MNKMGEIGEPCGRPHVTEVAGPSSWSSLIQTFLLDAKEEIHFTRFAD